MSVATVALGVHYIGVDFLEVVSSEDADNVGCVITLLYFAEEVDKVSTPLRLTLIQAKQLYEDLKQAFD